MLSLSVYLKEIIGFDVKYKSLKLNNKRPTPYLIRIKLSSKTPELNRVSF